MKMTIISLNFSSRESYRSLEKDNKASFIKSFKIMILGIMNGKNHLIRKCI
jgi:hypothetical protein